MDEQLNYYIEQLKSLNNEDAYHRLMEFKGDILSSLMKKYDQENDAEIKAQLLEIIYQRQQCTKVLQFLSQAVRDNHPVVWKAAIDGIVSIDHINALYLLQQLEVYAKPGTLKRDWITEAIKQIESNMTESMAVMKVETEDMTSKLISRIPEFTKQKKEFCVDYEDGASAAFGTFALIVRDEILKEKPDGTALHKAFEFLNEMADSGDSNIENLLTVGVLEIFLDHDDVYKYAMKALNDNGKKCLDEIRRFWNKE